MSEEDVKNEENQEEETSDNNEDVSEEETSDEIRDETYREDDTIEMLRSIEDKISEFSKRFDAIEDTVSMFVQSGATIREDLDETYKEDFEEDFVSIDDLDLSLE